MSGWLRVTLEGSADDAPRLEEALSAAGAIAIVLEDAGEDSKYESWPTEQPLWKTMHVSGLFPNDGNARQGLAARLSPEMREGMRVSEVPETDWVRAGRERVGPMRFGDRLWVSPSWADPPPEAGSGVVIRLDPGLAFGTGTHPSTRLCLEYLAGMDLSGRFVVDYGCGSGILAIAALALGAGRCVAVDIDPRALDATRANAMRNGVHRDLEVGLPDEMADALRRVDRAVADVVVANVLAAPLAALVERFRALARCGGELLLAGILTEQAGGLVDAYNPWFRLSVARTVGDWVLLAGPRTR